MNTRSDQYRHIPRLLRELQNLQDERDRYRAALRRAGRDNPLPRLIRQEVRRER